MKNVYLAILAIIGIAVIMATWRYCKHDGEQFEAVFNESPVASEFLMYQDMGDHRTMVLIQRGNSGKTVLLLHNSPMDLNVWQPLLQTMQRISYTGVKTPNFVTYDLRGHGTAWLSVDPKYNNADISNSAWTLDQFVDDCKKIYDQVIGGGKIKVCGFGFGGLIAQKFSLKYPESIEKLILLQTSTRPMPGLRVYIDRLSGNDGWIAKNHLVTYLTPREEFVQDILCKWFYLPKNLGCPQDLLADKNDDINDQTSPQFNVAARMIRQSSSTTKLQIDKILVNTDLLNDWIKAKNIPFNVHILAATDDPLSPPSLMTEAYTNIYNNNRSVVVALDIVNGKHGFTIMRPDYIAGIVCQACEHMSAEDTYSIRSTDHGY